MPVNDRIFELMRKGDKLNGRIVASYEKELFTAYKKSLTSIRSTLAQMYARYGDDVTYHQMIQRNRLITIEKEIASELTTLKAESKNPIESSIKDSFKQSYYFAGYTYESQFKLNMGFGGLRSAVVEAAILNPYDRIKWTARSATNINLLNNRVKQTVATGLIQGDGYVVTARKLKPLIERSLNDSLRIVRTESKRAQTAGNLLSIEKVETFAENKKIDTQRIWVATIDQNTRDDHIDMDGEPADANGIFTLPDGTTTEGPGLSGVAEQDINCRCTVILQIVQIPQQFRTARIENENVRVPYQTFSDWKKLKKVT